MFNRRLLSRLHWLNLPGALLLALLQRTPVLRVLATGAGQAAASPAAQLMRSAFTAASLGAWHALAGATTFVATQGSTEIIKVENLPNAIPKRNPATGTAGTALSPVAFTYTGTPSDPQYFAVTGQLPPGLSFIPAAASGVVRARAPVIAGTPTQAGSYTVRVQGFGTGGNGQPESIVFNITGGSTATPPAFTLQPVSQTATAGTTVTFTVGSTGSPAPTYQWRRNGTALAGATAATLTLPNVQPADAGEYSVVAANTAASIPSAVATLTVVATNPDTRLTNLSVRTTLAADQTLIVGVAITGGTRAVLVRAAGPALAAFGLSSAISDPRLDLFDAKANLVFANDSWPLTLADTFASVGAFAFAIGSSDAAMIQSLNAAYSIQARGTGPGVVLVEAYDTGAPTSARLINVSARNRVGLGDDILIAGFNLSGTGAKALIIRAVGPKLRDFGVTDVLADPKLEVFNSSGALVAENDTWAPGLAATFAAVGAFALDNGSRDAALLATLPPGTYTVLVRGADGGTGEALIEIYEAR